MADLKQIKGKPGPGYAREGSVNAIRGREEFTWLEWQLYRRR